MPKFKKLLELKDDARYAGNNEVIEFKTATGIIAIKMILDHIDQVLDISEYHHKLQLYFLD